MHQALLKTLIALVVAAGLLTIGQIWGEVLSWDTYVKAVITLGILVLLIAFLLVVKMDFGQQKRLKDENYLD